MSLSSNCQLAALEIKNYLQEWEKVFLSKYSKNENWSTLALRVGQLFSVDEFRKCGCRQLEMLYGLCWPVTRLKSVHPNP